MRLLYLSDRRSDRGGADHHLLEVVGAAVGAGFRVRWAVGRDRGADSEVPVEIVPGLARSQGSPRGSEALAEPLGWAEVVHVQNVMNPDALEAASATGRAVVTVQDHRMSCPGPGRTLPDGRACRRKMGEEVCPVCLEDPGYRRSLLELTHRRAAAVRRARRVLVLSRYMREEVARAGLVGAEVLPPWVDVDRRVPVAGEGFLTAGRLVAHKAPELAFEAWRRSGVGQPLRVAGAGSVPVPAPAAALGWLDRDALRERLRSSRALLFPSRWQEPLGIVGLEALAVGTPVIAMATGGMAEWTDRGCLVVEPGDVDGMAGAIRRLAARPDEALALGLDGMEAVRERYGRNRWEPRLLRIYEELRSASPKRRGRARPSSTPP